MESSMPITRTRARQLCTDREYELVRDSFHPDVKTLDRRQLRAKAAQARRLRDKQRTLTENRRRAERTERGAERDPTLTDHKYRLFSETLVRFETALERMLTQTGRDATRTAAKKALQLKRNASSADTPPASHPTPDRGMRPNPAQGRKGTFPAEGTRKGQLSAAVKRGQARRDARNG